MVTSTYVEDLRRREQRLPVGVRWALRAALAALALLLLGEFVLTLTGWRERTVPALLRARAEAREAQGAAGRQLAFHPTRLFSTAANHRDGDSVGRAPTGAWPFRGRPAEPAPDGLLRVVVLGDSGVHGVQLFEADTLPTQLAQALEARGLPPERVAVLGLGVPGYTTLQIERLWEEEVLGALRPDALVLSTALWNDRAPASSPIGQGEVLAAADPGFLARVLAAWSGWLGWIGWGGDPLRAPASSEQLVAAWRRGDPLYGPLVPRAEAAAAMRRVVDDAARRGILVAAVVPAHPLDSLTGEPGLAEDVDALRAAYEDAPAARIDGPRLLAGSGLRDAEAFLDAVHPSGPWNAVLADALADALADGLRERRAAEAADDVTVQALEPRAVPAAGDVMLAVRVAGLPAREIPAVVIGGQPLLDVERVDEGERTVLRGTLGADRPGEYAVLVQSSRGVARAPGRLRREAPRLEYVAGTREAFPRVIVHARPGDRVAELWAGGAAERAAWSVDGDIWLAAGADPLRFDDGLVGPDGRAVLRLDMSPEWPQTARTLQAAVVPAGREFAPGVGLVSSPVAVPASTLGPLEDEQAEGVHVPEAGQPDADGPPVDTAGDDASGDGPGAGGGAGERP